MDTELFKQTYDIMLKSFPSKEIRTFEDQKKILNDPLYYLYVKLDNNNDVIALLSVWEFSEFSYIEHFATKENYRGMGIGKGFLSNYLNSYNTTKWYNNHSDIKLISTENHKEKNKTKCCVILEVAPPKSDIAKRRIKFYEKLGFKLSPLYYEQSPLRPGAKPFELDIMSFPEPLSQNDFLKYTQTLKEEIHTYK